MYSRIALLYVKLKERSALEAGRMRHQRVTKQNFLPIRLSDLARKK